MSGTFFFPDNTVFINFAIIHETDLLEEMLQGRGKWVEAVHAECENSVRKDLYADLQNVFRFMSGPIILTSRQRQDALALRQQLSDPTDHAGKNLGEAQTLVLLADSYPNSVFITDDGGAVRYAHNEGIAVTRTETLLAIAVRTGRLDRDRAEGHINKLQVAGRGISLRRFKEALEPR